MAVSDRVRNLSICQNYIDGKTEVLRQQGEYENPGEAFLILVTSTLLDIDPDDVPPEDVVDTKQDKQIDVVHIDGHWVR